MFARLPDKQRSLFLIGPSNSWLLPNIIDLWIQPQQEKASSLSYFIYGCKGCFCYGQIHHRENQMSAKVDRLIDVGEDNSRVSCVRFLKTSLYPLAMILTESGTLLIHDCMANENLVRFKKSSLITKLIEPVIQRQQDYEEQEHCNKRAKFDNSNQQISSCLWPNASNAFIGVSLRKENLNLLFWLKLKDLKQLTSQNNKSDLIKSYEKLELDLPSSGYSPICCMEYTMLDAQTCLIAVAMDNGVIIIFKVNFEQDKVKRVIKLRRHEDQICSMSFYTGDDQKFPSGLLATASRSGLVLVWDIEKEFYFADYQTLSDGGSGGSRSSATNSRIDWFALSFIPLKQQNTKHINLVVSNSESGLTILEVPKNTRSKVRLRKLKKTQAGEQTLRHHKLLCNVVYDSMTETIITSSLDGNFVLWRCQQQELPNKNEYSVEVKPKYLFPSSPNNARTHMLRHSPIKEDLLGVALGESGVRFYKISENPMNHRFDMSPGCDWIARKIKKANLTPTSLAWHPNHEYRLSIGTREGKVMRADLTPRRATLIEAEYNRIIKSRLPDNSSNDAMVVSFESDDKIEEADNDDDIFGVEYQPLKRQEGDIDAKSCNQSSSATIEHHKTDGVYSLCWGPNPTCPQDISRLAIYAIGSISHRLFIYHNIKESSDKLTNYLDEFLDQSVPEAIGEASEVAWKSSMDLMALGTTTGKIIIASYLEESHADRSRNNLFKKLAVIQGPTLGTTYIQCLVWHPTTDKEDSHYYCIAASANESPAFVFNIKENMLVADIRARLRIEEKGDQNGQYADMTTNVVSNYEHKLDAHKKAISDIMWSPHESNKLATCSFDRCCYVWELDASTSTSNNNNTRIISKFSARHRLFTLEWSLVDTDLIFTSGHDSTIWAWRPSENHV